MKTCIDHATKNVLFIAKSNQTIKTMFAKVRIFAHFYCFYISHIYIYDSPRMTNFCKITFHFRFKFDLQFHKQIQL